VNEQPNPYKARFVPEDFDRAFRRLAEMKPCLAQFIPNETLSEFFSLIKHFSTIAKTSTAKYFLEAANRNVESLFQAAGSAHTLSCIYTFMFGVLMSDVEGIRKIGQEVLQEPEFMNGSCRACKRERQIFDDVCIECWHGQANQFRGIVQEAIGILTEQRFGEGLSLLVDRLQCALDRLASSAS